MGISNYNISIYKVGKIFKKIEVGKVKWTFRFSIEQLVYHNEILSELLTLSGNKNALPFY